MTAITYLRLVPVASRKAAGSSGPVVASRRAVRLEPGERGRRVGEVGVEADDPPGGLECADPFGRAAGREGGLAESGRRDDIEGRLEPIHRREDLGPRTTWRRSGSRGANSPSRTTAPRR